MDFFPQKYGVSEIFLQRYVIFSFIFKYMIRNFATLNVILISIFIKLIFELIQVA